MIYLESISQVTEPKPMPQSSPQPKEPKSLKAIVAMFAIAAIAGIGWAAAWTWQHTRQTTLAGQVFIVTQGAENIKLGDVEILLIEKSQVTNFLQAKQSVIQFQLETNKVDIESINNGRVPDVLLTDTAYAQAKSDFDNLQKQEDAIMGQNDSNSDGALDEATSIIEEMKSALGRMESAKSAVKANLENYPSPSDYFADFSPSVIQKSTTDSDGKFAFIYPRIKSFTLFATAQRQILDKTEIYYWLVDAPSGVKDAKILLSNNNLVYSDPDSYFIIKPIDPASVEAETDNTPLPQSQTTAPTLPITEAVSPPPAIPKVSISNIQGEIQDDGGMDITGIIQNESDSALDGVTVNFNFLDDDGNKVDEQMDFIQSLAPNDTWSFKVSSLKDGSTKYKLDSITSIINGSDVNLDVEQNQ